VNLKAFKKCMGRCFSQSAWAGIGRVFVLAATVILSVGSMAKSSGPPIKRRRSSRWLRRPTPLAIRRRMYSVVSSADVRSCVFEKIKASDFKSLMTLFVVLVELRADVFFRIKTRKQLGATSGVRLPWRVRRTALVFVLATAAGICAPSVASGHNETSARVHEFRYDATALNGRAVVRHPRQVPIARNLPQMRREFRSDGSRYDAQFLLRVSHSGVATKTPASPQLALPGGRQVQASWGASTYKEGGLMTGIEHINYRHAYNSGFSNVSRYAQGTSAGDIASMVDDALRYGKVTPNGANGYAIVRDFGRTVGTDQAGNAVTGIKVYVRDGIIQTAFPVSP
jgi:hypothetical protein